MASKPDSVAAIEPLLAGAVREPALAAHGSKQIERILLAAEQEIGSIAERADREARGMAAGAEIRARQLNSERRQAISQLKLELTERASALAVRFEAMLDQLEAAERELAMFEQESPAEGVTVTLTERRRITVAHDVATTEPPPAADEGAKAKRGSRAAQIHDLPAPADGPRRVEPGPEVRKKRPRRRWWRWRLREAA